MATARNKSTLTLAEQVAAEFPGQPLLEFGAWLLLAQQREGALMPAHAAALAAFGERASDPGDPSDPGQEGAPSTAYAVITRALSLVSRHEANHAEHLDRWKSAWQAGPRAAGFSGHLEGWVMLRAMSGNGAPVLTQWLRSAMAGQSAARSATRGAASATTLVMFTLSWEELETSAADGYARMLTLLNTIPLKRIELEFGPRFAALVPKLLEVELPRLVAEERCHAALLARVRTWCLPDQNACVPGLLAAQVLCELRELGEQHLALDRIEGLTRNRVRAGANAPRPGTWIGDAGLGELFAQHGATQTLLAADPG